MMDVTLSAISDRLGLVAGVLEWVVIGLELFAICILLLGTLRFSARFVTGDVMRRDAHERSHQLNHGRLALGRHILAGLEVLIVADLIRTILHLSIGNIVLLGAIVLIRSFISFMMEYEMRALQQD
ncbi:MAG: DUF1622 domain-containing protein [Paracoccus sp.]|nr:DUF1622 domain-containing protein [Paracoccus sp. (in: a-proteobacteria)]